jgi:hypothetical protein
VVYPQTPTPIVIEIAPDAQPAGDPGDWLWEDITEFWRLAGGGTISIDQGRADWGSKVDPGKSGLTLDNRSGDFSEWNPLGQWYGRLGKNTPMRIRFRRGEDDFGTAASNGWGTSVSGQAWTTAGSAASDYSKSGGTGRHSHGSTNVLRSTLLGVTLVDCEQLVDVATPAAITGAALVTGCLVRYQDASNFYWLRLEFNAGGSSVTVKLSKRVGGTLSDIADLTPVPALSYTAGQPLRVRAAVDGDQLKVKVWDPAGDEPAGWHLEDTDTDITEPGQTGLMSWLVAGNSNSLPLVVSFDNYAVHVDLWGGFVPQWDPRWDKSGNDRTVPISGYGPLYRLAPGQSKPPEHSALRRSIGGADGLQGYWPCEDGVSATQVASALPGHPPLAVTGTVAFTAVDDFTYDDRTTRYGTSALVDLSSGGRLSGTVPPEVTAATATQWTISCTAQVEITTASTDVVVMEWYTPGGTFTRWEYRLAKAASNEQVIAYNAAGAATMVIDSSSVTVSFTPSAIIAVQNGANIDVTFRQNAGAGVTASVAGTMAGITAVAANTLGTTNTVPMPFGHLAVWSTVPTVTGLNPFFDDYGFRVFGDDRSYLAEAAHLRLRRLGGEDGIDIYVPEVEDALVNRMGWQAAGKPLDLYRQCEDVDGGVLFERPFALAYQPRAARYNQTPALVLDAQDDLAEAPAPDSSDQQYRNRWEIKRTEGSSVVAQADEVTAGALVYPDSAELLLHEDAQLADQAGWRLHLTSQRGLRWPLIDIDLAARPDLIDQWLNCRVGSRIAATNPMQDVAGQDIDVLLEGYTLTIDIVHFKIAANCSYGPAWDVATADGEQRVPADGSTLDDTLGAADMTLSLASTAENGVWGTDAADFPLDIRVGGERITLSAISGTTSPQTATISARGVNGVQREWPAGSEVDVWYPAIAP